MTAMLLVAVAQERQVLPASGEEIVMTASPKRRCEPGTGDEITVCGRRDPDQFRLPKIGPRYEEKPVRSAFRIGNAEARVGAEQRGVGGVSVPSLMATIKIPLGRKKADTPPE